MHDSSVMTQPRPWILLLHQLPPKPDYFRVRVRRRLQQLGAVLVRNAVYVLPYSDQALEDLQWLAEEIRRDGGSAIVSEARFFSGITDDELIGQFNNQAATTYHGLAAAAREALTADASARVAVISRLERRLEEATANDSFGAPERGAAESALAELRKQADLEAEVSRVDARPSGAVWITRQGVFVDRIASAWLIRRFIDRDARFKFVPAMGYEPAPGELRFDMFQGEYGHEGDRCTFEVLLSRFELSSDAALQNIGEIVHDLDLRDEKYNRVEAPGLLALLQGLTARYAADAERIEHGRRFFDQLYSFFARG